VSDEPPDGADAIPPASDVPPRRQSGWTAMLGALVMVLAVLGVVTLVIGGVCVLLLRGIGGPQ
jgi:hypothetical protein